MSSTPCLRFVPSRVEGLPDVDEVAFFPDRLEVRSAGRWQVFRFVDLAKWPRPGWLWRGLDRLGLRRRLIVVGDRDWFHLPPDRFFVFYTQPRITVYMPADEAADRAQSHFLRVQQVIGVGGFATFDLG